MTPQPSKAALKRQAKRDKDRENPNPLESKRQKKVLDYLNRLPHCKAYLSKNSDGEEDIHACYRGWYLAIEMKRPGEEQTRLQFVQSKELKDVGGFSFVATCVPEVIGHLKDVDLEIKVRMLGI